MELEEVKTAAENAMRAFETIKTEVLPLKKRFDDLDADSKEKFAKAEKAVSDAIELSRKAEARALAAEEQQRKQREAFDAEQKALKEDLSQVKTAFNRASAGGASEEKGKALEAARKKAFNEFCRTDDKLYFDQYLKRQDDPEVKALSVNSDPAGGYLVMPEMGGIVETKVFESSPLRQLATVTTVGSTDRYEVVVDFDEAGAGWVGEEASRTTTTTPTLGMVTIPVNEIYANPKATQKILEDASMDMESWLAQKVTDQFARTEATAFVTGNGVMKPKGIMSYDAGTTISSQQVRQVNLGSTTAFTYAGFVDVQNSLKEAYQPGAVWLYQRASNASAMKILDGEGRPIFNMNYDKNVGLTPTLMGKPVYFAADVAAISSAALSLAYGDFRRAYQIVDRQGVRVLRDPYSSKPYVQFYTTKRVGGGVINFEAYSIGKSST